MKLIGEAMSAAEADIAIDAGGRALREQQMAGRITVPWDRLPASRKKKWKVAAGFVIVAALETLR